MRKIIFCIAIMLFFQDVACAYQIITTDKNCYTFGSGKVKEDPNRYKAVYEVDEANMTISETEETDLRTGEKWQVVNVYQIIPRATLLEFKDSLKGYRINPKRASVETISFCNGEYLYTRTSEAHVNLFYGTYEIIGKE